jgi:hypothetical protein
VMRCLAMVFRRFVQALDVGMPDSAGAGGGPGDVAAGL